jgi:hypothetical protein
MGRSYKQRGERGRRIKTGRDKTTVLEKFELMTPVHEEMAHLDPINTLQHQQQAYHDEGTAGWARRSQGGKQHVVGAATHSPRQDEKSHRHTYIHKYTNTQIHRNIMRGV